MDLGVVGNDGFFAGGWGKRGDDVVVVVYIYISRMGNNEVIYNSIFHSPPSTRLSYDSSFPPHNPTTPVAPTNTNPATNKFPTSKLLATLDAITSGITITVNITASVIPTTTDIRIMYHIRSSKAGV